MDSATPSRATAPCRRAVAGQRVTQRARRWHHAGAAAAAAALAAAFIVAAATAPGTTTASSHRRCRCCRRNRRPDEDSQRLPRTSPRTLRHCASLTERNGPPSGRL
eukprot:9739364-Alexandrium_andersonii.AAC.1